MPVPHTKYEWGTGIYIPSEYLIQNVTDKCNSMIETKEWIEMDPKETKILVSTTRLSK